MKKLAALLVAVALVAPAFAQKITFQGTHPRPKPVLVAPASNPVLLHTGKPITPDQKHQLAMTVARASALKGSAGTSQIKNFIQYAGTTTLTPDMMYKNDVATAIAFEPGVVDLSSGNFGFTPGASSNLTINVDVVPNTAYTLVFKVGSPTGPGFPAPQFNISTMSGQFPQTFAENPGESEFAYAFAVNSTGYMQIVLYSPNSAWWFLSCEIVATPMN